MRILGLDTATRATTVALCDFDRTDRTDRYGESAGPHRSGRELEARDDPARDDRPRHAARLLPLIVELLDRSGSDWGEIERIAVGVGPGTFTGLRIGIATARALGQARAIGLCGVSTLRSLAIGADPQLISGRGHRSGAGPQAGAHGIVLAVLDARRGEVFAAAWRAPQVSALEESEPADRVLAPVAIAPEALARLIPQLGSHVLAIGDGAVEFRSVLECSGAQIPPDESELHHVSAISHCWMAPHLRMRAPDQVSPEYLRLPDAEIARRLQAPR
ncbi:MAG: tRNA (adenosine(37)-N6)-threonylcarbamoyltransferase complex dimerization subunit type 1 TsaB [Solirubrobacteraceae bacterium]